MSPRVRKRQLQLLEGHYTQAIQLLELQEDDILYLLRDSIPSWILYHRGSSGSSSSGKSATRRHPTTLSEEKQALLEQCDYYVSQILMGVHGKCCTSVQSWPPPDLEGIVNVLQTFLDEMSSASINSIASEQNDTKKIENNSRSATTTISPALLVQLHSAIGLLRQGTATYSGGGSEYAVESLQKALWIQTKHNLLIDDAASSSNGSGSIPSFASSEEIGRTTHRLAVAYAHNGQVAQARSLLQAALLHYQKSKHNKNSNTDKYKSLTIVAQECLSCMLPHYPTATAATKFSPSLSSLSSTPPSPLRHMLSLFSEDENSNSNGSILAKSKNAESVSSVLQNNLSLSMLTIDEGSGELSLPLSPPSIPLLDCDDYEEEDAPLNTSTKINYNPTKAAQEDSNSTLPTLLSESSQQYLAFSVIRGVEGMHNQFPDFDHAANRMTTTALLGFFGGAAYATFKGLPRGPTASKTGFSCALVATSLFGAERVANIALREYGNMDLVNDRTRLTLSSHVFAGIVGGGLNGYLFQKKPLRGMFYFLPIMMCVGGIELEWQRRKEMRAAELLQLKPQQS